MLHRATRRNREATVSYAWKASSKTPMEKPGNTIVGNGAWVRPPAHAFLTLGSRAALRLALPALFFAGVACGGASPVPTPGPAFEANRARIAVHAVGCIGITVSSIDRVTDFYERVLTFRRGADSVVSGPPLEGLEGTRGGRFHRRRLNLGTECVELSEPLDGVRRAIPADSRSNDRWFQHVAIVVRDMDAAYAQLESNDVAHVSFAPQTLPSWNKNAAGIRAYYFKDPDGHTLELIWFPPDKGQMRWRSPAAMDLFLGIDHTAIASRDTDRSIAFYVGGLGLHLAGGSENYGIEQERLSGVPGAHVRITTLRADGGPGIELLDYVAPIDGRPMPRDERADDLIHWRTMMVADGVTSTQSLRDPDGHLMEIGPR